MESDLLFLWFLCGCYLLGGITIGYYYNAWRNKKGHQTGTGRWDWSKPKDYGDEWGSPPK